MQLVFQDPYSSLDPRRRIGAQIADGLAIHDLVPRAERPARVAALLEQVGLPPAHAGPLPARIQRRPAPAHRASRARSPPARTSWSPTSRSPRSTSPCRRRCSRCWPICARRLGLGLLFISHDLSVVRSLCDRVIVLYLGRVMEEGPAADGAATTRAIPIRARCSPPSPSLDAARRRTRILLEGDPPSPADPPSGCVFRTRCPWAIADCAAVVPPLARSRRRRHRTPASAPACIRDITPLNRRSEGSGHDLPFTPHIAGRRRRVALPLRRRSHAPRGSRARCASACPPTRRTCSPGPAPAPPRSR